MDVSRRADRLSGGLMPPYLAAQMERRTDAYDPATNPAGYISLCVAENMLMWDVMAPKMASSREIPPSVLGYDNMTGSALFREQLSTFLEHRLLRTAVEPDIIQVVNGAGSALDLLFYALTDPDEGVLVPTPSYAGFWMDLEGRDETRIVPVHCSSSNGFRLTIDHLDETFENADRPIRALLFTSPNNPLGTVYTAAEIREVVDWCRRRRLHLVMDEIYGLSTHGDRTFVSVAEVVPDLGDDIHIVWAFSKDFAASGLRCGVVVSRNDAVRATIDALAYWSVVSGDTQHLLGTMISDSAWVDHYVSTMQDRLGRSYDIATKALSAGGVPYLPADAGFFFLVDVRGHLDEPTWDAEDRLWRRLLDANVNITPGSACRIDEPGFMRLCFAGVAPNVLEVGIDRVVDVLNHG